MQRKQQKGKEELESNQILHPVQQGILRTFTNPVCKETYDSLPKIYGKKKKKIVEPIQVPTKNSYLPKSLDSKKIESVNSANSRKFENKTAEKIASKSNKNISGNKIEFNSTRVNSVNRYNRVSGSAEKIKKSTTLYGRNSLLPEIRRFQLDDLQSQHKVSLENVMNKTNFQRTGLQKIIEQNDKLRSNNQSKNQVRKVHEESEEEDRAKANNFNNQKGGNKTNQSNLSMLKMKHKNKTKFNNHRFQIEEDQDQNQEYDEIQKKLKNRNIRNDSDKFKTEGFDTQSPKSANSLSLTSLVFTSTKKGNTKFYELNLSEKSMDKKFSRKPSQLSNGLFRIPQQEQFGNYLKGYKNISPNFNVKSIVKRPNFRVERNQKGVYFGQYSDEHGKHGEGINVTQKQIFQGRYDKNIKTGGCQRNIDGYYIGQFKNGKRSGFGVFRWNNGEVFEGNWQNGVKTGHGTWKSPKGDYYQGEWLNNRQHGQGVFKHRLSTYKGEFKNFLKDGFGQEVFANGDRYEGTYKQGKPHGRGRYQWNKGGIYQGQFIQGMREGWGKWIDEHKTTYQVQAISNQILSMDLESNFMLQVKDSKDNSTKVQGQVVSYMTKVISLQKQIQNEFGSMILFFILSIYGPKLLRKVQYL